MKRREFLKASGGTLAALALPAVSTANILPPMNKSITSIYKIILHDMYWRKIIPHNIISMSVDDNNVFYMKCRGVTYGIKYHIMDVSKKQIEKAISMFEIHLKYMQARFSVKDFEMAYSFDEIMFKKLRDNNVWYCNIKKFEVYDDSAHLTKSARIGCFGWVDTKNGGWYTCSCDCTLDHLMPGFTTKYPKPSKEAKEIIRHRSKRLAELIKVIFYNKTGIEC
jgi:hypothetical protein